MFYLQKAKESFADILRICFKKVKKLNHHLARSALPKVKATGTFMWWKQPPHELCKLMKKCQNF